MGSEPHADVAGTEGAASERELIAAVRGSSRRLDSLAAAHELGRRRPRRWGEVLGEVVRDRDRPENLRAAAAVELGGEQTPENEAALLAALDPDAPALTRRAAEALGRIGDAGALARLAALPPMPGPAEASVDFAKTLISYRLGLGAHLLEPPPRRAVMDVADDEGVPIDVEPLAAAHAEQLLEELRADVPAIPLSPAGALRLTCGGDARFVVLFTERAQDGRMAEHLTRASGVVAVVFEWSEGLQRYDLAEYLLTHPETVARLRLFGVRPTGALVHIGELLVDDGEAAFNLHGLDRPHSLAVTIAGSIDRAAGETRITAARADPDAPARRTPGLRLREPDT